MECAVSSSAPTPMPRNADGLRLEILACVQRFQDVAQGRFGLNARQIAAYVQRPYPTVFMHLSQMEAARLLQRAESGSPDWLITEAGRARLALA